MYRPSEPFNTTAILYNPTTTIDKGVAVKEYNSVGKINCLAKTYGGTESVVNDVYSVIDTVNIETWYRDDITSESRLMIGNKMYEVMGVPEDISFRHQFLKFKVRGVRGGS